MTGMPFRSLPWPSPTRSKLWPNLLKVDAHRRAEEERASERMLKRYNARFAKQLLPCQRRTTTGSRFASAQTPGRKVTGS